MIRPVTVKRIGLILPVLFLTVLPWSGPITSASAEPVSDGLPPSTSKQTWQIFTGKPTITNLAYAPRDVIPAACRQLEKDKWEIYHVDESRGEIVTRWKSMHHALVWLFMGHVNARCTVTMERIGPNLTRMVFRGDLASRHDLHDNPMIGRAERAYAKGARDYANEVRDYLDTHHRLSATEAPSGPATVMFNRSLTRAPIER
jgi:hypothetical protein